MQEDVMRGQSQSRKWCDFEHAQGVLNTAAVNQNLLSKCALLLSRDPLAGNQFPTKS